MVASGRLVIEAPDCLTDDFEARGRPHSEFWRLCSSRWQGHDKATASVFHDGAVSVTVMVARNLAHQRQAQTGSCTAAGVLGTIERLKHAFKLRLRYALTTVPYGDNRAAGIACNPHPRGRRAMATGVLQKIA